jgi:hypothetical protein
VFRAEGSRSDIRTSRHQLASPTHLAGLPYKLKPRAIALGDQAALGRYKWDLPDGFDRIHPGRLASDGSAV